MCRYCGVFAQYQTENMLHHKHATHCARTPGRADKLTLVYLPAAKTPLRLWPVKLKHALISGNTRKSDMGGKSELFQSMTDQ